MEEIAEFWAFGVVILIVIGVALLVRLIGKSASARVAGLKAGMIEKSEAMFRSMFPELQPHFHPKNVHEFVKARRARGASSGPFTWKNPPGFAAATAEIEPEGVRENVRVLDAAGVLLAGFIFEEHAEGGVLRVGQGKITANIREAIPRVRYWHPDREFKWTPNSWKFQSRMADDSIDSSDRGTSWSSSDSSSSSLGRTAAAAGIVGAGGAFDGGGASQSWDGAADSGASSDSSSGATATSY